MERSNSVRHNSLAVSIALPAIRQNAAARDKMPIAAEFGLVFGYLLH